MVPYSDEMRRRITLNSAPLPVNHDATNHVIYRWTNGRRSYVHIQGACTHHTHTQLKTLCIFVCLLFETGSFEQNVLFRFEYMATFSESHPYDINWKMKPHTIPCGDHLRYLKGHRSCVHFLQGIPSEIVHGNSKDNDIKQNFIAEKATMKLPVDKGTPCFVSS